MTLSSKLPVIGEQVKVHLPGESPWAECVFRDESTSTWEGKILNLLVAERSENERKKITEYFVRSAEGGMTKTELAELESEDYKSVYEPVPVLHRYKQDDIVKFKLEDHRWVPAEEFIGRC